MPVVMYDQLPQDKRTAFIEELQTDSVSNGAIINDLVHFSTESKTAILLDGSGRQARSYAHQSGHPASRSIKAIFLGGDESGVAEAYRQIEIAPPYIIKETPLRFEAFVKSLDVDARLYHQVQYTVTRERFQPSRVAKARRLNIEDIDYLEGYLGTQSGPRGRLSAWLNGAIVVGSFDNKVLASVGSTLFVLPEVAVLVSISTLPSYRRRGHAGEVTSVLTELCLMKSSCVALTSRVDNVAANSLYERLGYTANSQRLWASIGTSSEP